MTQGELALSVNRSSSTVSTHIARLKEAGVLDSRDLKVGSRRAVRLAPDVAVLAGVTVYHRGVRGIVTNALYEPLEDAWFDRSLDVSDPVATLSIVAGQLAERFRELEVGRATTVPVAIGLPTPVNVGTQSLPTPYGLEKWERLQPGLLLEKQLEQDHGLSTRVFIHNDASLGALGCFHVEVARSVERGRSMARRPHEPLVYVRVSDGIGMGLIINGVLYGGAKGYAGEFGHVKTRESRAYCKRCGRDGCLEAVASTSVLLQALRERGIASAQDTIHDVLDMKNSEAVRLLRGAGKAVGAALAHATTLLNPRRIVIGGAPSKSREFMRSLERELRAEALPETFVTPITAAAALGTGSQNGAGEHPYPELAGAVVYASQRAVSETLESRIDEYVRSTPSELLLDA